MVKHISQGRKAAYIPKKNGEAVVNHTHVYHQSQEEPIVIATIMIFATIGGGFKLYFFHPCWRTYFSIMAGNHNHLLQFLFEADDPQTLLSSDLLHVAVLCAKTQLKQKQETRTQGLWYWLDQCGWGHESSHPANYSNHWSPTLNGGSVRESSPKKYLD